MNGVVHVSLPDAFDVLCWLETYAPTVSGWFRGFRKMVSFRLFLACFRHSLRDGGHTDAIAPDAPKRAWDKNNNKNNGRGSRRADWIRSPAGYLPGSTVLPR